MATVFGTDFDALTAFRFGRYADAYATDGNEFGGPSVRGLAALHLGRVSEAHALAAHIPADAFAQGYIPQLFQARLAEADGKYDEAEQWIEKSLQNQRSNLEGELIPLLPAGEALGDLRLRRGDGAAAVAAFIANARRLPERSACAARPSASAHGRRCKRAIPSGSLALRKSVEGRRHRRI